MPGSYRNAADGSLTAIADERSFADLTTAQFVTEIVTTAPSSPPSASTSGPFDFFGFRPRSLAHSGHVAFLATLDAGATGITVGDDAVEDRVIVIGDHPCRRPHHQPHVLRGRPQRVRAARLRRRPGIL